MIGLSILLGAVFVEFPPWEEFEPYEECFGTAGTNCSGSQMIAEQENRQWLVAQVEPELQVEYQGSPTVERLLKQLIIPGTSVVDYGMGIAASLSECVGGEGMVHSVEKDFTAFHERYWQLARLGVANVLLYCASCKKDDRLLDARAFGDVSVVCIDAQGKENGILTEAAALIAEQRPALLINMVGGIALEEGDKYVKKELRRRLDAIETQGYHVRRVEGALYLALPL